MALNKVEYTIDFNAQVDKLNSKLNEIKKNINNIVPSNQNDKVSKIINDLENQLDKLQKKSGQKIINTSEFGKISNQLLSINNQFGLLQDKVKKISELTQEEKIKLLPQDEQARLQRIDKIFSDLIDKLAQAKEQSNLLAKARSDYEKQEQKIKKATIEKDAIKQLLDEATAADENQAKIKSLTQQYEKATTKVEKYSLVLEGLKKNLDEINTTTVEQSKIETKSALTTARAGLKKEGVDLQGIKLTGSEESINKVRKAIQDYNNKALKPLESSYDKVETATKDSREELGKLNVTVEEATHQFIENNEAAKKVDGFIQRIQQFAGLTGAAYLANKALHSALNSVKELDAQMTEMAVVTDLGVGDYWKQLPEYTKRANELGVSITDAYKAATLYYQQGLKANEVNEISVETLKLARIANIDAADATNKMTAALRGFNMEISGTNAKRISDVYSKLAAITAADVEEISVAMTKTASLAHNAGMEFETTAAFLSQIVETTRESAETAGTALKTVIARFQELKKSPDEIGEVDGEIVDANKIETALRSVGVALRDTSGQFRDLDDVFIELSSKWQNLDTNTQRYIATIAAGSRQQSRFIAMMSDYKRTQELITAANNSAGASNEQFGKTLESLEVKLTKLKNAWAQFSMSLANNTLIKWGVDLAQGLLSLLNNTNKATSGYWKFIISTGQLVAVTKLASLATKGLQKGFSKVITSSIQAATATGLDTTETVKNTAAKGANLVAQESNTTATMQDTVQTTKNTLAKKIHNLITGETVKAKWAEFIQSGFVKIGLKAETATTIAATMAKIAYNIVLLAGVAAVAGLVYGIYKLITAETKEEKRLRELEENHKKFNEELEESEKKYETASEGIEDLTEKYKELNKEIKGNTAWKDKAKEINEAVKSIIDTYPELKKYYDVVEGIYVYKNGGKEEVEAYLKKKEEENKEKKVESALQEYDLAQENYKKSRGAAVYDKDYSWFRRGVGGFFNLYALNGERTKAIDEYFNLLIANNVTTLEDAKKIWKSGGFDVMLKDWDKMPELQKQVEDFLSQKSNIEQAKSNTRLELLNLVDPDLSAAMSGVITEDLITQWISEGKNSDDMVSSIKEFEKALAGNENLQKIFKGEGGQLSLTDIDGLRSEVNKLPEGDLKIRANKILDDTETALKEYEDINENLTYGALTGLFGKGGKATDLKAQTAITDFLKNYNASDQQIIADLLVDQNFDFSDKSQWNNFLAKLRDAGIELDVGVTDFVNNMIGISEATYKDFTKLNKKSSELANIIQKMTTGEISGIFSEEEYNSLMNFLPDLKNDFKQNIDGTYSYTGATDIKKALKDRFRQTLYETLPKNATEQTKQEYIEIWSQYYQATALAGDVPDENADGIEKKGFDNAVKTLALQAGYTLEEINEFDDMKDLLEELKANSLDSLVEELRDAMSDKLEKQIDSLTNINDSIKEANEKLIDKIQTQIDDERNARAQAKTEQNLQDLQTRLAYLRRDTSGANAKQILELEKQLTESQQNYEDDLIDQAINNLKDQNDKAYDQRKEQIDLLQAQLDLLKNNSNWGELVKQITTDLQAKDFTTTESYKLVTDYYQNQNLTPSEAKQKAQDFINLSKKFGAHYATGGLNTTTGPAWLDGTRTRPELVLNAADTQNFLQLKDVLSNLRGQGNSTNIGDAYYDINISVDSVNNDYDVDKMANRIKQLIVNDSNYRNVNDIKKIR